MIWPTLARLTLDTTPTRSPAMITGVASGSSTVIRRRSGPYPIAVAACLTGLGTPRRPSTTFGRITQSENTVSPITTVVSVSPNAGISAMNRASEGIA